MKQICIYIHNFSYVNRESQTNHVVKKGKSRPRNHTGNHPEWLLDGFSPESPLAGGSQGGSEDDHNLISLSASRTGDHTQDTSPGIHDWSKTIITNECMYSQPSNHEFEKVLMTVARELFKIHDSRLYCKFFINSRCTRDFCLTHDFSTMHISKHLLRIVNHVITNKCHQLNTRFVIVVLVS